MSERLKSFSPVRRAQFMVLLFSCAAVVTAWAIYPKDTVSGEAIAEDKNTAVVYAPQDFSKFDHRSAQHNRMPCLVCHIRKEGATTPKMPGHTPCAACHVQQFADNQNAICTICHTATDVKRFPPLRSFNVTFNHAVHTRQTNCATCHRPSRGGAALSMPSGGNGHITCFRCHGPQTQIGGRNIGSCATCHQSGRPVHNSDWSRAYTVNFNHREHLSGTNMNCVSCHAVQRGSARGRQVTEPLVSMHFAPPGRASCGACHNNKRAFGPPDFADCKRCHEGKTFRF